MELGSSGILNSHARVQANVLQLASSSSFATCFKPTSKTYSTKLILKT